MSKLKKLIVFLWWNGPGMIFKYKVSIQYIFNNPFNKDSKVKLLLKILWWKVNKAYFKLPVIVQLTPKMNYPPAELRGIASRKFLSQSIVTAQQAARYDVTIKCICYPDNSHYSTFVLYTIFPEYGEMMMVEKLLKKDDIFLDVGANIGVYSLIAASKITSGKIYAFEPSVKCLPILHENIYLNQIGDRVQVIEKVVSDKTGFLDFDISSVSDYNHISYSNSGKDIMKLPSTTLDDFILENKIPHIKLIKIDVEGVEILVLRGLQKSLAARKVDILIIEITDWTSKRFGYDKEQVYKYLKNYGFKLYYFDRKYTLKQLNDNLDGAMNIIAIHSSKNWKGLGII